MVHEIHETYLHIYRNRGQTDEKSGCASLQWMETILANTDKYSRNSSSVYDYTDHTAMQCQHAVTPSPFILGVFFFTCTQQDYLQELYVFWLIVSYSLFSCMVLQFTKTACTLGSLRSITIEYMSTCTCKEWYPYRRILLSQTISFNHHVDSCNATNSLAT